MSIVKEFREFIARGNVIDLAVGVIIGAAFNSIVKSLVDQVIMPPIGLLMGGLDFSKLQWVLKPEDPATPAVELVAVQYGAFINTGIKFLIVAWVSVLMSASHVAEPHQGAMTNPGRPSMISRNS